MKILNIDYCKSILSFITNTIANRRRALPPVLGEVKTDREVSCLMDASIRSADLIFSTSRGVFLLGSGSRSASQILRGKYYGITRFEDYWILSRSNIESVHGKVESKARRQSDICAIKIQDDEIVDYKVLLWGIPGEIHQIDIVGVNLYMPHTGYNQILIANIKSLFRAKSPTTIFACRAISLDIFSPSHLNSIYYSESNKKYYLVAHNNTAHTDRSSDILIFSDINGKPEIIHTEAHSCHNICLFNDQLLYCNSNKGRLMLDNVDLFRSDMFLRGLSVNDDYIFVGGSDIDLSGAKRDTSGCCIYQLTHDGDLIAKVNFEGIGNLYEIRQLAGNDLALSA